MPPRSPSDPPSYSQATGQGTMSSRKRKFKPVYNPSASEQFPDIPWYKVNYQVITDLVNEMLDEIIIRLEKYAPGDSGINALLEAAEEAKRLPDLEKCRMAVLGDQAAGKSTLLTVLMGGRRLLDSSGDTKSCTAVPTAMVHKKGAADNTRESDMTIEWMTLEEILAHIQEQIRRWTDLHPGFDHNLDDNPGDGEDIQESSDDEDELDPSTADEEEPTRSKSQGRKALKLDDAASTAQEFFEVIFNTERDRRAKQRLEERLYRSDIRLGDFETLCVEAVQIRFRELDADLRVRDNLSQFSAVQDRDLREKRNLVKRLWPFVKLVTIATGHILLRYGMCFYDLPGFGDTNQLRAAHINRYRWKADLELIVAVSSRIRTNKALNKEIAKSVHMKKGGGTTILVMNKIDTLINERTMIDQISNIEEEPFPSLYERLCQCESEDIDDESGSEIPDELLREIFVAYVQREKRLVEEQLQGKDIAFFAASAESALEWKNRSRKQDPYLDPEGTGIPAIVRHFLRAPADTNLRNYHNHVTKVLPAWRARALRVLTKHTEDEHYAKMREDLSAKIPCLAIRLRELVPSLLEQTISAPWSCEDEPKIVDKIKELFDKLWRDPKIMYTGWRKMLRENGIPVAGVYVDRNLNEDVLSTIEAIINDWANKMTEATDGLAGSLLQLVKELVSATFRDINICNSTPELKDAAADALEEAEGEIEASYDTLLNKLNSSLDENHLHFTTEMDIECPIAKAMKPSYERALDERFVQGGRGIYKRQKKVLKDSMLKPKKHYVRLEEDEQKIEPLIDALKEKLMSRQRELWTQNCTAFIDSVIEQLEEFCQTAKDLLTDADFMSKEHQEARAELKELLEQFDDSLDEVQEEFANLGLEAPVKKIKLEPTEDSGVEPTFAEPSHFDPTEPAPEDVPSVPIVQNLGWHHFLANQYPLKSQ
ncbi:hypothetical protein HBH56_212130 [Parastagonospora nodorum]|uniref:Uncharacterized protein n=1 Tax=Phaeosphaeria nodorum (strain SN15 / ATCC MYA-4574 / FGSC 10173) TaxID=321614 RepID=A0A7U2NPU7_PHANO|nr:hypothetical protein HBH56_212130 [Parastagonospora nodorum]QRD06047.1 hypothetical protein JI435_134660 [Parastagonospora nodorum SN15]KAH3931483.1 hypothetical protein HBH54_100740 [Parastagonospora nodorum]KAH3944290.1 hypothetical protein HBH53_162210 [Parastagonospora nodorum]KAH4052201.1 hypothetical protein HBH49_097850 [Parastagonospora nodorum]